MSNQTLQYCEIVAVDLEPNSVNFADSLVQGHRIQLPIPVSVLNYHFRWKREIGSDRPVGYVYDTYDFQRVLEYVFASEFFDLDGQSPGLECSTQAITDPDYRTNTINDIIMAFVLFKVYGNSRFDTRDQVFNVADALGMVSNTDVSTAIVQSINDHNARSGAIDQMFRDLLDLEPGRFFTSDGTQIPGIFEESVDSEGEGSWMFIEGDRVQFTLEFIFLAPVSRRSVRDTTPICLPFMPYNEEIVIPAQFTFRIRLQLYAIADAVQ